MGDIAHDFLASHVDNLDALGGFRRFFSGASIFEEETRGDGRGHVKSEQLERVVVKVASHHNWVGHSLFLIKLNLSEAKEKRRAARPISPQPPHET